MLELLKTNLTDLKKYIDIAFSEDKELIKYFDKTAGVSDTSSMCGDVWEKLKDYPTYFMHVYCYKVVLDKEPIGFVFITKAPNLLVSFSINKKHRNKEVLKEYFDKICIELDNDFECMLYNENSRGINWLEKCGMDITEVNNIYTKLNYNKCQYKVEQQ
jgi:hypothetical protein